MAVVEALFTWAVVPPAHAEIETLPFGSPTHFFNVWRFS
jgi:hypothetical protein